MTRRIQVFSIPEELLADDGRYEQIHDEFVRFHNKLVSEGWKTQEIIGAALSYSTASIDCDKEYGHFDESYPDYENIDI